MVPSPKKKTQRETLGKKKKPRSQGTGEKRNQTVHFRGNVRVSQICRRALRRARFSTKDPSQPKLAGDMELHEVADW